MADSALVNLPDELLVHVLTFLPLPDLLAAARTSRRLHAVAQDPTLWARLLADRGLKLRDGIFISPSTAPGSWDGRGWRVGALPSSWSLMRSVARLFRPALPAPEAAEADPGTVPVHFPTLVRARHYLQEEMALRGPHRAYDAADPGRGRRVGRSNAAALVPDDNEDDDDDDDGYASDVSLVSIGSDGGDVYPNHLFLGAHGAKVYAVRAAGRWVVSGSRDSTFRIWRLPDLPLNGSLLEYMPQEVYAQVAHEGSMLAVAVEDQGETGTIVTGGADACVKVWEVQWGTGDDAHWTGTECRHVATVQHGASVSGVALTREYLVSCSHDGDVRIYKRSSLARSPELLHTVTPDPVAFPTALVLSPHADAVLLAGYAQEYVFVTLATGAVAREHSSVADISAVHWADGVYASGGAGGEVEIVRPARWPARRLDTSTADGKRCRAIHAVPELEMMYAASHAGAIRRISWAEPRLQNATYRFHEEGVFSLDRSGPFLVAAVNTHVAIITYGVGRPYSGLFA